MDVGGYRLESVPVNTMKMPNHANGIEVFRAMKIMQLAIDNWSRITAVKNNTVFTPSDLEERNNIKPDNMSPLVMGNFPLISIKEFNTVVSEAISKNELFSTPFTIKYSLHDVFKNLSKEIMELNPEGTGEMDDVNPVDIKFYKSILRLLKIYKSSHGMVDEMCYQKKEGVGYLIAWLAESKKLLSTCKKKQWNVVGSMLSDCIQETEKLTKEFPGNIKAKKQLRILNEDVFDSDVKNDLGVKTTCINEKDVSVASQSRESHKIHSQGAGASDKPSNTPKPSTPKSPASTPIGSSSSSVFLSPY